MTPVSQFGQLAPRILAQNVTGWTRLVGGSPKSETDDICAMFRITESVYSGDGDVADFMQTRPSHSLERIVAQWSISATRAVIEFSRCSGFTKRVDAEVQSHRLTVGGRELLHAPAGGH
jgi:hypothetical protein